MLSAAGSVQLDHTVSHPSDPSAEPTPPTSPFSLGKWETLIGDRLKQGSSGEEVAVNTHFKRSF